MISKILEQLERVWKNNPDYRLGQLINIATQADKPCHKVFCKEDIDLLEGLLKFDNRSKEK